MVRKVSRIIVFLVIAAVMLPMAASAATIYDGNISTTYITIFRDIASKLSPFDDYVFFRSDQYEYMMVVGDFDYSSGLMSADGRVTIYAISTNNTYNSSYVYSVSTQDGFSISPGESLIYSNLGDYPDLILRSDYYELSAVLLLLVGLCCYLLRSVFGFCSRKRN